MTGPGVEHASRAMTLAPAGPSADVSTSLPPHIQEAERRTESRTRHTGSRCAQRVLVANDAPALVDDIRTAACQPLDGARQAPTIEAGSGVGRHDRYVPGVSRLTGGSADGPEHQVIEDPQRIAHSLPEQQAAGPHAPSDQVAYRPSITAPRGPADVVRVDRVRHRVVPASHHGAGSSRPQHRRTAAPAAISVPCRRRRRRNHPAMTVPRLRRGCIPG